MSRAKQLYVKESVSALKKLLVNKNIESKHPVPNIQESCHHQDCTNA